MSNSSIIEKRRTTAAEYEAEVLATYMGHRCGYVTVPEGHPCADMNYDEVAVDVHGGLTYGNGRTFGFDCAHLHDAKDPNLMSIGFRKAHEMYPSTRDSEGTVRTLEFCVRECEKLAVQLKEVAA